jgi:hypothetical protein
VDLPPALRLSTVVINDTYEKDRRFHFDSGAHSMMTPFKEQFYDLKLIDNGQIYYTGNGPVSSQGIGTLRIRSFDGDNYIDMGIKDVQYIPSLPCALFSEPVCGDMW